MTVGSSSALLQLPKIMRAVKFEAAGGFPRGYEADFQRALFTFRHQVQSMYTAKGWCAVAFMLPACLPAQAIRRSCTAGAYVSCLK